jgi:hypothetical protein
VAGMELDIDAARAATAAARANLAALPPLSPPEARVQQGAVLLRHDPATPTTNTAAERLQELVGELVLLTDDVISALDRAVATMASTESANADQFVERVR